MLFAEVKEDETVVDSKPEGDPLTRRREEHAIRGSKRPPGPLNMLLIRRAGGQTEPDLEILLREGLHYLD